MGLNAEQYQDRAKILFELLDPYLERDYDKKPPTQEKITLAIRQPFHYKIAGFLRDILHCQVSTRVANATENDRLFLDVGLDSSRLHEGNLPHLKTALEEFCAPKYLMLDAEILRGLIKYPSHEDIVLERYDCGSARVLSNGYGIMLHLRELTKRLGYEIVLHSNDDQKNQMLSIEKFYAACQLHDVRPQKIKAVIMNGKQGCDKSAFRTNTIVDDIPFIDGNDEVLVAELAAGRNNYYIAFEESEQFSLTTLGKEFQKHTLNPEGQDSFDGLIAQIAAKARETRTSIIASITDEPAPLPIVAADAASITDEPAPASPARSTSSLFFSTAATQGIPPDAASPRTSLTENQKLEIQTRIDALKKTLHSWVPCLHKARKRQKVDALERFLVLCKGMDITLAMTTVEGEFPTVNHGSVHDLLFRLSNEGSSTKTILV